MTNVMCNINVRKRHEKDRFLDRNLSFGYSAARLWRKATGKEKSKDFVVLRVVLKEKRTKEYEKNNER